MAPFVSPLVQGKLVEQRRYQTNIFKPAYIKDKRAPDLRKPVRRMIGERIGGEMSGAEREAANLEFELTDQVDVLNRRLEWMGAQALTKGQVIVEGEGFDTVVVDFGRDPELTVGLTSAKRWTRANIGTESNPGSVSPSDDVTAWATLILKKSGAQVRDIVFSISAAGIQAGSRAQGRDCVPGPSAVWQPSEPRNVPGQGAKYMGRWGTYDLWIYSDWFVDDNNVEHPLLPDGGLIMSGPDLMGTRAFGMILDPEFNYQSLPFAPKTWVGPGAARSADAIGSADDTQPRQCGALCKVV